jgi:hypothetical protein
MVNISLVSFLNKIKLNERSLELLHFPFNHLGANKALKNNNSMEIAALTFDGMIGGFPNPVLPLVTADPTFEDTMMTQKLLNANCISIPSLSGGGRHGHLGIIITVQEYAAISHILFGVAVNPRQNAQVASEITCIITTRLNFEEGCKKQILASYANMYTEALEDHLMGYANVTTPGPTVLFEVDI